MTDTNATEPTIPSQMQRVLDVLEGARSVGSCKWEAFCPAHDDQHKPSLSVAIGDVQPVVLYCHAHCTVWEIEAALRKRDPRVKVTRGKGATSGPKMGSSAGSTKPERRAEPLPNLAMVAGWHERLKGDAPAKEYLRSRGINKETLVAHRIGWNGRSYTLPVFDHRDSIVNLRTYDPTATPKMRGLTGRGSHLYPGEVLEREFATDVVLCEGEWDALLLDQNGIPAVTGTAGARTFKDEWAAKFKGKSVWIVYDCDDAGRTGATNAAGYLKKHAEAVHVVDLGLPDEGADVTDWFVRYERSVDDFVKVLENPADSPLIAKADEEDGFTLGSDVQVSPVFWVWKGYIPLGKISILEGNPERFKTTIAMDLIARVTKGRAMPGTKGRTEPGSVFVVCAEDDADDTLVPRLMAVGADLTKVAFYKVGRDEDGQVVPLSIPDDLQQLESHLGKIAARTGVPVRLIVIDPITAYLSERINSHNDASVRKALYPLGDLAGRRDVAVLLVRHLNKDGSLQAEFRGGGSIAFTGAARSVLVVEKHPDEPGKYVLARVKNNLHAPVPSVMYEGVSSPTYDAPKIRWITHVDLDATSLLRGKDGRSAAPARKAAETFLAEVLSDGPMAVPEVEALAKRAGVSWRTVERAKNELRLLVTPVRHEGGKHIDHWEWALPYPIPGLDRPRPPQSAEKEGKG